MVHFGIVCNTDVLQTHMECEVRFATVPDLT